MTDLRSEDFDHDDLPSAEDAPPVERDDQDQAAHDDADNPDVSPDEEAPR